MEVQQVGKNVWLATIACTSADLVESIIWAGWEGKNNTFLLDLYLAILFGAQRRIDVFLLPFSHSNNPVRLAWAENIWPKVTKVLS